MPGRFVSYIVIIVFLLCGNNLFSQDKEYIYDHYNIATGLISDNVFKIFTDRSGYIWIITYNGLQKYDGYEFKTYTSNPAIEGTLSSNFVVDIFEDRDGDIIIVLDDGIDIYHKQTDQFKNLLSNLPFAEVKRNEITRQASVVQDKSGSIWTTCHNQLVRIDSTKENFFVYPDEFTGNFVLNHDSTELWIITESTFKRYDLITKTLSITNVKDIQSPVDAGKLNTIYVDSKGICWLGTSGGLLKFDEHNYSFTEPELNFSKHSGNTRDRFNANITAIYEDYNKDLWVASGNILSRIDRPTGNIQMLEHETENKNSILKEPITGIYGNRSGIIWLTYLNEGFTSININTRNFKSYRFRSGEYPGLGGRTVRSVFKDPAGFIWVGLYNDGLDRIDRSSGLISHFRHDPDKRNSVCSNYISSLYRDANQRLWVGSHDNGLCYVDHIYDKELIFVRPEFLNNNDEIYHIQGDRFGRIWFGTRMGLGMFDYRDESFHWILKDHNVQSFLFDENTIWIASWDFGLCKLNFSPEQFTAVIPAFDSTTSKDYRKMAPISGNFSSTNQGGMQNGISIHQDPQSNIWVGTYDKGLARVFTAGNEYRYKFYDVSRGAPGNAVYGVTGDEQGNIWISTEHGIGKFDPESEIFENFYRDDGLLSDYFMWKSYYRAPDGEFFFGSVDGLNLFYPHEITKDTINLKVLISELRIQNRVINYGDTVNGDVILHKHITYQDTLILNYRNNTLSFEFITSGQLNTTNIIYKHMLAGYDENWITHEKGSRLASYNNLPHGTYYFRVKASISEGTWSERFSEKKIVVLPPWWETKVAYTIYAILLLGLIFLITYFLIRFLKLKHELIYNEKLHQSKLMFFTYVSHEFKTPLSLILAPLDELLNSNNLSPHARKNLGLAKQNADSLLGLVNELMEFRRTDIGISKLKPEQIELTSFATKVAQKFEFVAAQKEIQFLINFQENRLKIWVDTQKFRKIINNLIENAMKYTPQGGLITLSMIMNPENYKFRENYNTLHLGQNKKETSYIGILVSDTGVGISKESLPKIFDRFYQIDAEKASHHIGSGIGLALVKNLVLMHQGEIRVASERGEGTDILIMLPLGQQHLHEVEDGDRVQQSDPYKEEDVAASDEKLIAMEHDISPTKISNRPRILLVEDHSQLRGYLKDNFSGEYQVLEASNGKEGLKILEEIKPDLIITDWIMPVMDGKEFISKVKTNKSRSSIPVIFLTARDELHNKQEGLDLGADQVITKPFNIQLLKIQVKRIIENNRARKQKYGTDNLEHLMEVKDYRDDQFLDEVERVIYEHIKDPELNAAFIARELTSSRTALYTKIRQISGMTLGAYIQKIRLKHAIKLMMYENLTVSEVYVRVGISSSSYLIRLFRKYYKTTPKEFIKNFEEDFNQISK